MVLRPDRRFDLRRAVWPLTHSGPASGSEANHAMGTEFDIRAVPPPGAAFCVTMKMDQTMSIVTTLSSAAILANPDLLIPEQQAGHLIYLDDLDRTVAPDLTLIRQLIAEEEEEAADMATLSKDVTGIDNVIFVSTK